MLLISILSLSLLSSASAFPLPSPYGKTCHTILQRREWRSLTLDERKQYLDAVVCLKSKPPASPNPYGGVKSLYDHFQAQHVEQAMKVHWSGVFLPFHRLYISAYEKALNECGWEGGQPYWSWSMDVEAGSLEQNPMFDDEYGFGGNGVFVPAEEREVPGPDQGLNSPLLPPAPPTFGNETVDPLTIGTGGGCVSGGRFSESQGWTVNVGTSNSTDYNPHCLKRDFDFSNIQLGGNRSQIEQCLATTDYASFHICAEGRLDARPTIHGSGHGAIGAEMNNVYSSPGDPLFFMHHTNLDRVWWKWQHQSPAYLHDIGDNLVSFDFSNTVAGNATVGSEVGLGALHESVQVWTLFETDKSPLCYTYIDPPSSI